MATTVTINTGTPTWTIPAHYHGWNLSSYGWEDFDEDGYQDRLQAAGVEVLRYHRVSRPSGTPSAPEPPVAAAFGLFDNLLNARGMDMRFVFQLAGRPASSPSTANPCSTSNVDTGLYGVAVHGDWAAEFQRRFGDAAWGIESYNEPVLRTSWYADGFSYSGMNHERCRYAWCSTQQRRYRNEVRASAPGMNHLGLVISNTNSWYGPTQATWFMDGDFTGWPYADDNRGDFDALSIHWYGRARGERTDRQNEFNGVYWTTSSYSFSSPSGGYLTAGTDIYRSLLDARGLTNVPIYVGEASSFSATATSAAPANWTALKDSALAITAANNGGRWKMSSVCWHSANRSSGLGDSGWDGLFWQADTAWGDSQRYATCRDIWGRFLHNYKRQVGSTVSGTPGMTPASTGDNSIRRVQYACGLNASGTQLAILCFNADFSNTESVTWTVSGQSPTGNAAGYRIDNSSTWLGTSATSDSMSGIGSRDYAVPAAVSITRSGSSFTRTMQPGEAALLVIPLDTGTPPSPPGNITLPQITGSNVVGSTLTCSTGTWSNSPTSFAYQWFRGTTAIGTGASTYTSVTADIGQSITCRVTASNGGGSTDATSAAVVIQDTPPPVVNPPVNTALPVITGSAIEGQTVTCSTGTWSNNPTSFAYQWLRNGGMIAGATASTRLLTSVDVGAQVACRVTASNSAGDGLPATSAAIVPTASTGDTTPPLAPTSHPVAIGGGGAVSGSVSLPADSDRARVTVARRPAAWPTGDNDYTAAGTTVVHTATPGGAGGTPAPISWGNTDVDTNPTTEKPLPSGLQGRPASAGPILLLGPAGWGEVEAARNVAGSIHESSLNAIVSGAGRRTGTTTYSPAINGPSAVNSGDWRDGWYSPGRPDTTNALEAAIAHCDTASSATAATDYAYYCRRVIDLYMQWAYSGTGTSLKYFSDHYTATKNVECQILWIYNLTAASSVYDETDWGGRAYFRGWITALLVRMIGSLSGDWNGGQLSSIYTNSSDYALYIGNSASTGWDLAIGCAIMLDRADIVQHLLWNRQQVSAASGPGPPESWTRPGNRRFAYCDYIAECATNDGSHYPGRYTLREAWLRATIHYEAYTLVDIIKTAMAILHYTGDRAILDQSIATSWPSTDSATRALFNGNSLRNIVYSFVRRMARSDTTHPDPAIGVPVGGLVDTFLRGSSTPFPEDTNGCPTYDPVHPTTTSWNNYGVFRATSSSLNDAYPYWSRDATGTTMRDINQTGCDGRPVALLAASLYPNDLQIQAEIDFMRGRSEYAPRLTTHGVPATGSLNPNGERVRGDDPGDQYFLPRWGWAEPARLAT